MNGLVNSGGRFLFVLTAVVTLRLAAQAPDPELGKRIYRQGLLPSGEPVRGIVRGDIIIEGVQLKCAGCHRRSGFGSSEGAAYAPPITAAFLFNDSPLKREDLFRRLFLDVQPAWYKARVAALNDRPAYSSAALSLAIREGKDVSGRSLDPIMPRYSFSDAEMGHLQAYLKTLEAEPPPGIDEKTIHFATVVGQDTGRGAAMLGVMAAYFKRKNQETSQILKRPGFSPWYKADFLGAYRLWRLHVWTLKGPPESWARQLHDYYAQQPVFAMIGGYHSRSWQPVHDFCERVELPCFFPNTQLPALSETDYYTLYFSKGAAGEGLALAKHLTRQDGATLTKRMVQVYRSPGGEAPAQAMSLALGDHPSLRTRVVNGPIDAAFWQELLEEEQPTALVLWLADEDLAALPAKLPKDLQRLYLSASLLRQPAVQLVRHGPKTRLVFPFTLPGLTPPRTYRVRAWLRSRSLVRNHERVQLNTYFALTVVDHALVHLVEHFSRDYLIERVEHETENGLNPGVFPHLSLGPGQRYASKGAYIVKASAEGGMEATSPWIVP